MAYYLPDFNVKANIETQNSQVQTDSRLLPTIKSAPLLNHEIVTNLSSRIRKAVRCRNKTDLLEIILGQTNQQRQQIRGQYLLDYGRDLYSDLKKELRGNFQDLILSLLSPPVELICRHLNKAMTGLKTNEKTLVELLVPRTNQELRQVVDFYESMFGRPLVEHVCSTTSKYFRRLLTSIIMGERDESLAMDETRVRYLAAELYAATDTKRGKDQIVFSRILARENFSQLRLVFDQFEQISGGVTIEEAVANEMSGDLYDGIIAIIECVRYIPGFFGGCLFRALKGWGTDDAALIRILVTRSEIDLGNILESYQLIYNKDLRKEIKSATSGEYRCALLTLLGSEENH